MTYFLRESIVHDKPWLVKLALRAGADITLPVKQYYSALDLACLHQHVSCVNILLQAGAQPDLSECDHEASRKFYNSIDGKGFDNDLLYRAFSSLHALYEDDEYDPGSVIAITKLLIEYGANSYLQEACNKRDWVAVSCLLTCGAHSFDDKPCDDRDNPYYVVRRLWGICPCYILGLKGKCDFFNLILARHSLSANKLRLALLGAIRAGERACVDLLLAQDFLLEPTLPRMHETILFDAYNRGMEDVLIELIARGADINEINRQGNTVLALACRRKSLSFVQRLIAAGADVNFPNDNGDFPLHKAALRREPDIAAALIAAGARLAACNEKEQDALSHARAKKNEKLVAFLSSRI